MNEFHELNRSKDLRVDVLMHDTGRNQSRVLLLKQWFWEIHIDLFQEEES
tara:strand:+ start:380 stop:529 length:150 start_codon:yes stop_codon:yes gene_type:complete